ncbi:MAG: ATP-dependent DNA helicase [Clostridiales bacterium]|nr:ATP-dependent DNA helicase [Clostridiales bacterium]
MEKPTIRISVRNLVEFICRSGDLDSGRGSLDREAMAKGSRLHRKIQKQMGGTYRAEVTLAAEREFRDFILRVEGRADGIFMEDGRTFVDEIKGIHASPGLLSGPVAVHRAQALCYAFMYARENALGELGIQMTYGNLETEEIRRFREILSFEELTAHFERITDDYSKWVSFQLAWRETRNFSMKDMEFPFPYRAGQREMVTGVYHTISSGRQIFIQAPTGVGKTMSAIFPAVRAMGEGMGDGIFYLTAKTVTRTVAEEAFSILRDRGLRLKVLTITSKEKVCFCEKPECTPVACPWARGHYDRVNDAVFDLWTSRDSYDRETLLNHARERQVCPFEMCLDLAVWADAVICDYNYVFDPNAYLRRFFGEGATGKYIFLIDEAHNLAERGREMYSAALCKEDVLETRKLLKGRAPGAVKALSRVNRQLLEMKKTCEDFQILSTPGELPLLLLQVMGEMEKYMEESEEELLPAVLDFYFQARDFVNIAELVDENYVIYEENTEEGKFRVKLFCVNPAARLGTFLSRGRSTVFFSATLLPMKYYQKLLSVRTDDYGIYVPSPFPRENRQILVAGDVSSRYTRRNHGEYHRIAEYIAQVVWKKKGNYMVFFPSYRMMEDVFDVFEGEFSVDWVRCICQNAGMNEAEKEEFLGEFQEESGEILVGFCVMGGIFSEGVDLMGNRLIGAIVVGTGIPQISHEREILKRFYDQKGENGFDYAYRYPGMNKVLQAAGRVIRTDRDVGVIVLLDDRFLRREYEGMFPAEWADRRRCQLRDAGQQVEEFWKGRE